MNPADVNPADAGSADANPAAAGDLRRVDPVRFGWNVADFDLGEPLGYVTTVLRYDTADVGWWGHVGAELPTPPDAGTRGDPDDPDHPGDRDTTGG